MVQRSVYTIEEIIQMINSGDQDEQSVGARNLWAFWNGWVEHFLESLDPDGACRKKFESVAPTLKTLLENELTYLKSVKNEQPRHIWHYILSLGTLHYFPALSLIQEILFDTSILENVRGFAADALTRFPSAFLDKETESKIWNLILSDGSLPVRVNSIRVIGNNYASSKNDTISKKLWDCINHQENSAIISTLMMTIGNIGSKAVVPDLVHTLITRRTGTLKKDAGLALDKIAEINGLRGRDALIETIKGSDMS